MIHEKEPPLTQRVQRIGFSHLAPDCYTNGVAVWHAIACETQAGKLRLGEAEPKNPEVYLEESVEELRPIYPQIPGPGVEGTL